MKSFKYLITISTFIVLSLEGSNARNSVIHREDTATFDPTQHLKMTRDHLCHYYQELAQKFPKASQQPATTINVEQKYNVDLVSPKEAPLLLGLALMEGGTAPKADQWFVNFYDPFGESRRMLPKARYAIDFRADLVIGLHHQWPEFIYAMKARAALAKQPKDGIKRKAFAVGEKVRVRSSVENLTQDFYLEQPQEADLKVTTESDQFINPMLVSLTTRAFAARKQLWQTKRGPLSKPLQARAR